MSQPPKTLRAPRSAAAIQRVLQHIEQHLSQPLALTELAGIADLSVWRLATVFRQQVGVSPHRYICRLRVERAQQLMQRGLSAACAAAEAGFYDQSHLSRHFKMVCGVTPGQFLSSARAAART